MKNVRSSWQHALETRKTKVISTVVKVRVSGAKAYVVHTDMVQYLKTTGTNSPSCAPLCTNLNFTGAPVCHLPCTQ